MESIDIKFQNICRACKIEADQMFSIFQNNIIENNAMTVAEMLMACTSLKISPSDGMPSEICNKCIEQLKMAFVFKKQCEETDSFLRQCLFSTTIKLEIDIEAESQNNNKIKIEPNDNLVNLTVRSPKKRGRPKKINDEQISNKELKVILKNIGNEDVPESSEFEVNKRDGLRKSSVKYEGEDEFSDSALDFAEVDPVELLNHTVLNTNSDIEWNNSDNENKGAKEATTSRKTRGRPRKNTSESVKTYECPKCNMQFKSKAYLKQHENSEHNDDEPFICEICPQKFSRRDFLIEHTKSHLNELNHDCEICGQKLETIEQLAKHKFSKHSTTQVQKSGGRKVEKEKHKCEVCGKLFSSLKHRENHIYLAHNKIYYCKTCTLPFRGREAFYLHNTRSNECSKKYLCPDCGARFSATSALKVHIRRHRGEKPFKCQYCEKGFSRKFDLITHETRHRGEKNHLCTICGKGFNRRHMLTIHMRTHTGEKPYKCCYCDAAFTQNNDLKTHIRRHTGERFTCDICDEKFLMHYLLSKHKRVVHGIDIPPAKPILERVYAPLPPVTKTEENP